MIARRFVLFLRLVRFSHTIFALPFAVMGALLAAGGLPEPVTLLWICVAMVGARSAAMAMNRLADHRIDAENPRTKGRELPSGKMSRASVWCFLAGSVALFEIACAGLNRLTLALSPIVLVVLLGYPYAKRFTSLCHVWLGVALGLAPVGAWVAVRGGFGDGFGAALCLGIGVVLWTAGFDIIYALLDVEHDREAGIFSLPSRFGRRGALRIAAAFHVICIGLFTTAGVVAGLSTLYFLGVAAVAALLVWEHRIVRPDDLSRLNTAFFTLNGGVSLVLMFALAVDLLL